MKKQYETLHPLQSASQSKSIFTPSALSLPAAHIKGVNPARSWAFTSAMPVGHQSIQSIQKGCSLSHLLESTPNSSQQNEKTNQLSQPTKIGWIRMSLRCFVPSWPSIKVSMAGMSCSVTARWRTPRPRGFTACTSAPWLSSILTKQKKSG